MPTPGSADRLCTGQCGCGVERPPVLVLGLGNLLLGDDGIGLTLLTELRKEAGQWGGSVEFVDGGTQGLMLLGQISGRPAVLVLDAVDVGKAPGTLAVLRQEDIDGVSVHRSTTAHEGNAGELLAAARMLGESPGEVTVIGVQPEQVATGIGLSETVQKNLPPALLAAKTELIAMVGRNSRVSCCAR